MFDANVLPRTPEGKVRDWKVIRSYVLEGFNRSLPAQLQSGGGLHCRNASLAENVAKVVNAWQQQK